MTPTSSPLSTPSRKSTRNPAPNVALNASDYISKATAEKAAVDVLTTPQRSSVIDTASASAFKPAKRQTGLIPPTSDNRTSNSSSTALPIFLGEFIKRLEWVKIERSDSLMDSKRL